MIKVDASKLKTIENKYKSELKRKSFNMLGQAQIKGTETVLRFTPPLFKGEAEKRSIEAKHYKRPVYNISKILNSKDLTEKEQKLKKRFSGILINKVREGNKFFAIHDVQGRRKFWFQTNERRAKQKYQRIKYRGFQRVMYGLKLLYQGFKSSIVTSLINKSPELKNLKQYNELVFQQVGDVSTMENVNKAIRKDLLEIHKKKVEKRVCSEIKSQLNKFNKQFNSKEFKK